MPLGLENLEVANIANTIQTAIAPVFMLAGIAGILNVISTRLGRTVDRTRVLVSQFDTLSDEDHVDAVHELRMLDRRITYDNAATTMCVASALAICLVIILLFVGRLARLNYADAVAVLFVIAMLLLAGGLIAFLIEIRVAIRALHIPVAMLEREERRRLKLRLPR
jgi:Trk-type K+ transport system membrane component